MIMKNCKEKLSGRYQLQFKYIWIDISITAFFMTMRSLQKENMNHGGLSPGRTALNNTMLFPNKPVV